MSSTCSTCSRAASKRPKSACASPCNWWRCRRRRRCGRDAFDEQFEDLLKVEDSIAARVAQALIPQMTGEERSELARPGTASAKAHQAYLRGRWYWSRFTEEALPHALVQFADAVAEDPGYARAHAGIADYHIALGIWGLLPPMESFAAAIDSARVRH